MFFVVWWRYTQVQTLVTFSNLLPPPKRSDEVSYVGSVDSCQPDYWKNMNGFDEILWRGWTRPKKKMVRFWCQSGLWVIIYNSLPLKDGGCIVLRIRQVVAPFSADVWALWSLLVRSFSVHMFASTATVEEENEARRCHRIQFVDGSLASAADKCTSCLNLE